MRNLLSRLWREEDGATMVEYALMVGLIAAVCIAAVTALGTAVSGSFQSVVSAF